MHTSTLYRGEGGTFGKLLDSLRINFHDCRLGMIFTGVKLVFSPQASFETLDYHKGEATSKRYPTSMKA